MATSGSTDFNNTASEIIKDAHALIGVVDQSLNLSSEELALGQRALNRMIKAWNAKGLWLWTFKEGSFSTVADTQSYSMGSGGDYSERPLQITQCRHVEDSIATEMFPLTREEYFRLPDKSTSGKPTNYYYDPQLTTGTLYIWPTDSGANTLKFTYRRPLEDIDSATDDPDFPPEWLDALTYNLAVRLAPFYGVSVSAEVANIAAYGLDELEGFSREDPGSVYFGIDSQYM